jgi:hypothetical protein
MRPRSISIPARKNRNASPNWLKPETTESTRTSPSTCGPATRPSSTSTTATGTVTRGTRSTRSGASTASASTPVRLVMFTTRQSHTVDPANVTFCKIL